MAGMGVPAYEVCLLAAIAAGCALYARSAQRAGLRSEHAIFLLTAGLVGGALGAKLPILVLHGRELAASGSPISWLSGRTVIGGLAGAVAAVLLVRRRLGILQPMGNHFAPAAALGIAIGRIGCLLRGCCYGRACSVPWGVDMGDHVSRHPTQLYEALFAAALFGALMMGSRQSPAPGALFRAFMLAYCSFRFLVEFLREGAVWAGGLTMAQWACIAAVAIYALHRRPTATADPGAA